MNEEPVWVLSVIGLLIALLPVKWILKFDRLSGYQIYKTAPSEEKGLRRAKTFYILFGIMLALCPWLFDVITQKLI